MNWVFEPLQVTPWQIGIGVGVLLLGLGLIVLGRMRSERRRLQGLAEQLGLGDLPLSLIFVSTVMWSALLLVLVTGLFTLVIDILTQVALPRPTWDWRFKLVQITALTTVLGAVVLLPITLNRLRLQRVANETAEESLFNEKINAATQDLYARRQRSIPPGSDNAHGEPYDVYEDDITRRNAAIYRLEGLVKERPEQAERVSRLLSIYVRELSTKTEVPAKPVPEGMSAEELRAWARTLHPRSDMQNAVQTLGRLRRHVGDKWQDVKIDLRGANLQGIDFEGGDYRDALVMDAQMQGANLSSAKMQRARLNGAHMQAANFYEAQMQGADLSGAQMQVAELSNARMKGAILIMAQMQETSLIWARMHGANLSWAQMQGANLWGAQMQGARLLDAQVDENTSLNYATLQGAALRSADETTIERLKPFWGEVFADGSVQVPEGERPAHWPKETLNNNEFETKWHVWMRSIGIDPETLL